MPKVFVSFSSRDNDFAGKLLASLRLQEVDYWDYSDPAQDTPLGADLQADLRRRIDGSDFLIAILTSSSVDFQTGRFCILELLYGRERLKPIIPVSLTPALPRLSGNLGFLADLKYLSFSPEDNAGYEYSFAQLCEAIGATYVPPFLGDPRIIFAPRFDKEIRGFTLSREHRAELRLTVDDFTRAYRAGKWSEAEEAIAFFLLAFRRWVRGVAPYYPSILRALCQMHLAEESTGPQSSAEKLAEAALALKALIGHPFEDENLWGSLGQIDFIQGNYAEALAKFKTARHKCPPGKDWEARFNIMASSIALGCPEEVSAAFENIDLKDRPEDDQVKVANLQASWFLRTRDWRAVIVTLRDVIDRGIGDDTSAIYLSESYENSGRPDSAVSVLSCEAGRRKSLDLYHRLASLYVRVGRQLKALAVYEEHLLPNRQFRPWQVVTDYALVLRSEGCCQEARERCEDALRTLEDPAQPGSETYFRGLASYLLGQIPEAEIFFRHSRYEPAQHYSHFAPPGCLACFSNEVTAVRKQ